MFVSVGMSGAFFLIAKDLFTLLFTARWNYAAELFQLMAIGGFAWPVSSLMCNIISGVGNSKAFLRLEVIKRLMLLPVYLFGFFFGLKGFICILLCVGGIGIVLNGFYTAREIAVDVMRQCQIMLGYILVGIFAAGICFYFSNHISASLILRIAFNTAIFGCLYIAGAYASRLSGTELINFGASKLKTVFRCSM
jgi:O-antigen/teichoic acid export membrane protein